MNRLFFPAVVCALCLGTANAQPTIFLVRHAEKADATKDSDLSAAGRARAEALAKILRDSKIAAIYVTEFKRTQETAAPVARELKVPVTKLPAENGAALAAKLRASTGNALVVGHGNTVPDIIRALGISEPINITENDYDNLFIVVLEEKPRLVRLHYP